VANDDYEGWIRTFFEGTWLVPGWNARVASLVDEAADPGQPALRARLEKLGHRIAPEWARENDVRRIDSTDLERWGRRMSDARQRGRAALMDEIAKVETEVEARLA
jgi:hypothetical protein